MAPKSIERTGRCWTWLWRPFDRFELFTVDEVELARKVDSRPERTHLHRQKEDLCTSTLSHQTPLQIDMSPCPTNRSFVQFFVQKIDGPDPSAGRGHVLHRRIEATPETVRSDRQTATSSRTSGDPVGSESREL